MGNKCTAVCDVCQPPQIERTPKLTPILPTQILNTDPNLTPDDFKILKLLGQGSFGKVFLVTKDQAPQQGAFFAMKVLRKELILQLNQVEHIMSERLILEGVNSPFIVHMHYAFQTQDKLYLVMDFVQGGELFTYVKTQRKLGHCFTEEQIKFYAAEVVVGLNILHKNGVVYRDLKPENILIDSQGHIKMADFGLSKLHISTNESGLASTDLTYSVCGTPEYVAPEILSQGGHNHSVDWWSFGILLYEMYTGQTPFAGKSQLDMLKSIHSQERVSLAALRKCSHEFRLLIRQLLMKQPAKRLGYEKDAYDVMQHSFFNGLDW